MEPAAIGFRDHSGWAVMALLAGPVERPRLVERRRFELIPPELPRQPYHAVAERGAPRDVIDEIARLAREGAHAEIEAAMGLAAGLHVAAAGVGAASMVLPADPEAILRAHAQLHAAEGELFRHAIAAACADLAIPVHRFPWRECDRTLERLTGLSMQDLRGHLEVLRRTVEPPWGTDERQAVFAAWIALAGNAGAA